MKKAIITYFEPFGGRKTNASKEVVLGMNTIYERVSLPVSWKRTLPILDQIMKSDPRYLFMVGEAGDYSDVTIELVARNICSGVDEDGVKKDKDRILRAMPKEFRTNFKLEGSEFTTSDNAGRFLCNYVYYIALLRSEITKVIFIHVPYLHSKGSRKKEAVIKKVEDIIHFLLEKDNDFLARLNNKVVTIDANNAYSLYPDLQREHNLPNILIATTKNDDGTFTMTGRADGYKGVWYEYGNLGEDELKAKKIIYYRIARYQMGLSPEERNSPNRTTLTSRFITDEYYGLEKVMKRFVNLYICRADYTNELLFYESLDKIYESNLKSVLDFEEEKALRTSKEYVSRMGYERTKELLFKIVPR